MDYTYIAYNKEKRLVKGKISAADDHEAAKLLNNGGYQVVNLKISRSFLSIGKFSLDAGKVGTREILTFSRQLALLTESGLDLISALELLQKQSANRYFQKIIGEVITDVREGTPFSSALSKYPKVFPRMYHRAIAAGEKGGNFGTTLRQMADFLEREVDTRKRLKAALTYPIAILAMAVVLVIVLSVFVLPTFVTLFDTFGGNLPPATRLLMLLSNFMIHSGLYVLLALMVMVVAGIFYIRTPQGKYRWDRISLRLPVAGHIIQLTALAYCCRIMALLFKVGLPPVEIIGMAIQGTGNKILVEALTGVQEELVRGEGLSTPMSKRKVFLPLMVQMVAVGESTGNLTNSLTTVAQSYEMESDDRTKTAISLIQPVMTVVIGVVVAFVAIALVSAIFGVYNEFK